MILEKFEIFDLPVSCVNMEQVLEKVSDYLQEDGCHTIFAVNPEKVIRCETDKVLLSYLVDADILIPDGIGVVIAVNLLSNKKIARVAGADLMPQICELSLKRKNGIFLFGSTKDVNDKTVDVLKSRFKDINIVGRNDGYVNLDDMDSLMDKINSSKAEILFVALGSPAQEKWISEHKSNLNYVKVIQGVGGTFDALTGNVKRAPKVLRDIHLEWLYRLISQPGRLIRQTALPKFVVKVLKAKIFSYLK